MQNQETWPAESHSKCFICLHKGRTPHKDPTSPRAATNMTRVGQTGRCWPGTGTSPVPWAINGLTPMQFPLGIRTLCSRQHRRNWHLLIKAHSDFLVDSCKTSEHQASLSEKTATQGNAHGIYIYKYLPSIHCLHEQRPRVEDLELWAALRRENCRTQGLEGDWALERLGTSKSFTWAFLVEVSEGHCLSPLEGTLGSPGLRSTGASSAA